MSLTRKVPSWLVAMAFTLAWPPHGRRARAAFAPATQEFGQTMFATWRVTNAALAGAGVDSTDGTSGVFVTGSAFWPQPAASTNSAAGAAQDKVLRITDLLKNKDKGNQ